MPKLYLKLTADPTSVRHIATVDLILDNALSKDNDRTLPVTMTSPLDNASGIDITNVSLDWETSSGATEYKWQLDHDTDFSTVPTGFEGSTRASTARLPTLELDTKYYWQARVTEPVLSPWSTKWSFTTSLGYEATAPQLQSPKAGASEVTLKPVFQWSAVAGADSYELVVSTSSSLDNPTIIKIGAYALPSTAWRCNVSLDCDTAYYWKVKAIGSDTQSDWSAVGAFTTELPPSPPEPPSLSPSPPATEPPLPPALPPSPPQPATPHWVVYLVGGLVLIIILLLTALLVLVATSRRP